MNLRRVKFCPKCGKENEEVELVDSLCKECFKKEKKLLEVGDLELSVCKKCDSYFKGGKKTSIEKAVGDFLKKEIRKKYGYEAEVEEVRVESDIARVFLDVKVDVKGVKIEEKGEIKVIFKKGSCETCSKKASRYYEAIVQVRAENRIPTEDELAIATEIAYSSLGEEDFVSKMKMLKEGLDFYFSRIEYGRKVSKLIINKLGGSIIESRKLFGRKGGRNVYRVSFSVRLPFQQFK